MLKIEQILPEAIRVIMITSIAYVGCYVFELGYALYFGMPIEFISISVSSFLVFAVAVGAVGLILLQFYLAAVEFARLHIALGWFCAEESLVRILVLKCGMLCLPIFFFWMISGYEYFNFTASLLVITTFALDLIPPLFRPKGVTTGQH